MSRILGAVFGGVGGLSARHDDELTDRLVSRYTATVFVCLCVVVTTSTFVGSPIDCWCPAQFTGTHTSYTNAKCLISPTYYVPMAKDLPGRDEEMESRINYYVWVPFILLCQALMCHLPSLVWKGCYKAVGFNVPSIVERLESSQNLGWENRDNAKKYVVEYIGRYTDAYRDVCCKGPGATWCCVSKRSGNYLLFCFLLTKLFYVAVSAGQFLLLNWFLGMDFHFLGWDMISRFITGGDEWSEFERFPKVTICKFDVRHMNQIHPYVVQCVLPINLFNERIFLFIWCWLIILSIATAYNLCRWLYKSLFWRAQINHVKTNLYFPDGRPKDFKSALQEFTTKKMRRDAMFLLRLLSHSVGPLTEAEVLKSLWDRYYGGPIVPTCPPPEPYDSDGQYRSPGIPLNEVVARADGML